MPKNSILYFGPNGTTKDQNGKYFTTDQGFGYFGKTDSKGILTVVIKI